MAQFITLVATSIEQSQQLIELGVKPETADLVYRCTKSKTDSLEWELQLYPPSLENIENNDIFFCCLVWFFFLFFFVFL